MRNIVGHLALSSFIQATKYSPINPRNHLPKYWNNLNIFITIHYQNHRALYLLFSTGEARSKYLSKSLFVLARNQCMHWQSGRPFWQTLLQSVCVIVPIICLYHFGKAWVKQMRISLLIAVTLLWNWHVIFPNVCVTNNRWQNVHFLSVAGIRKLQISSGRFHSPRYHAN